MNDYYEIDFLPVHTSKSGDAIAIRYQLNGAWWVHVVDGGYTSTAPDLEAHIRQAIETCQRIGLNEPEARGLLMERSKEACTVMDKSDVWRAVLTLAERLPTTGRMPGDTVVSIVQNALRAL